MIGAKAESDAMHHTRYPQAETGSRSRASKPRRAKKPPNRNAEAAADAKVTDSKAEAERRRVLAAADADSTRLTAAANADTIRVTASADSERLQGEAAVLKENPMLIQKIIAGGRTSQIIMVPTSGDNFFASERLRSAFSGANRAEHHGRNQSGSGESRTAAGSRQAMKVK